MRDNLSAAEILAGLSEEEREKMLSSLSPEVLASLKYNWKFWARTNQLPPEGEWTTWLILAGRGFGKTRCGAEWVRQMAEDYPGCRIAIVGETYKDVRKTMIEGESGILSVDPTLRGDDYSPANGQITWPNGSMAFTYNATQPDQLRGPQHHFAWADELAKWDRMQDSWDQLQFGLRLGKHPRQVVTTTPRPLTLIRKLVADPDTIVTRGSTRDNEINLATPFIKYIEEQYGGTRLGRQELDGEILDDMPGALWNRESIDNSRVKEAPKDLSRLVVAVDPAASSGEDADETGIVAVGVSRNEDGIPNGYVLADRSLRGTPEEWARKAVNLYRELQADRIIAEKNNGGEMVEAVIKSVDRTVPVTLVHASRGKVVRAEPISALYEQGRVHHVGRFDQLEDQMCLFSQDMPRDEGSPDRVDALVWGLSHLFDKIVSRRKVSKEGKLEKDFRQAAEEFDKSSNNPNIWMV
jgi:phage terminase large subunit-like protein